MTTLLKDHKPPKGGIARTRPVVNGASGMNAPLIEILNTLVEQIARNAEGRIATLSTEDCLDKIDTLNDKLKTILNEPNETNTQEETIYRDCGCSQDKPTNKRKIKKFTIENWIKNNKNTKK